MTFNGDGTTEAVVENAVRNQMIFHLKREIWFLRVLAGIHDPNDCPKAFNDPLSPLDHYKWIQTDIKGNTVATPAFKEIQQKKRPFSTFRPLTTKKPRTEAGSGGATAETKRTYFMLGGSEESNDECSDESDEGSHGWSDTDDTEGVSLSASDDEDGFHMDLGFIPEETVDQQF